MNERIKTKSNKTRNFVVNVLLIITAQKFDDIIIENKLHAFINSYLPI